MSKSKWRQLVTSQTVHVLTEESNMCSGTTEVKSRRILVDVARCRMVDDIITQKHLLGAAPYLEYGSEPTNLIIIFGLKLLEKGHS